MRKNKGQSPIQYATIILVIVALVGSWMAYTKAGGAKGVTKKEVESATKGLATKSDLKDLATKSDLKDLATKSDLKDLAKGSTLKSISDDILSAIRGKKITESDVVGFLSGKSWSDTKTLLDRAGVSVPKKKVKESDVVNFLSGKSWSDTKTLLDRAGVSVPAKGVGKENVIQHIPPDQIKLDKLVGKLSLASMKGKLPGPEIAPTGGDEYTDLYEYQKDSPWTIALSYCGGGIAWDEIWIKAFKKEIQSYPEVKKVIVKKAFFSPDKQEKQLESFLMKKKEIDAIVIVPISGTRFQSVYQEFLDAGIPVVNALDPIFYQNYTVNICDDDRVMGAAWAYWLAKKLGGKGKIVNLRGPHIPCGRLRQLGASKVLNKYPNINVLETVNAAFAYDKGKRKMSKLLSTYGDQIDGVLSQAGSTTMGCIDTYLKHGKTLVPMSGEIYNGLLGDWLEYHENTNFDTFLVSKRLASSVDSARIVRKLLSGTSVKRKIINPNPYISASEESFQRYYYEKLPKFIPTYFKSCNLSKEEAAKVVK